jgi:hypothetical protein
MVLSEVHTGDLVESRSIGDIRENCPQGLNSHTSLVMSVTTVGDNVLFLEHGRMTPWRTCAGARSAAAWIVPERKCYQRFVDVILYSIGGTSMNAFRQFSMYFRLKPSNSPWRYSSRIRR